jgi:hypothetical protein
MAIERLRFYDRPSGPTWYRVNLTSIEKDSALADIAMIDPEALRGWDDNANRQFEYRELFEHKQMLSRSDDVVTRVLISGEPVWEGGSATDALGQRTLGRALRAA